MCLVTVILQTFGSVYQYFSFSGFFCAFRAKILDNVMFYMINLIDRGAKYTATCVGSHPSGGLL